MANVSFTDVDFDSEVQVPHCSNSSQSQRDEYYRGRAIGERFNWGLIAALAANTAFWIAVLVIA